VSKVRSRTPSCEPLVKPSSAQAISCHSSLQEMLASGNETRYTYREIKILSIFLSLKSIVRQTNFCTKRSFLHIGFSHVLISLRAQSHINWSQCRPCNIREKLFQSTSYPYICTPCTSNPDTGKLTVQKLQADWQIERY
jgi:hypothetical protein